MTLNLDVLCLFSVKLSPFYLNPSFRGVPGPIIDRLELHGVYLSSTLNFGSYIEANGQTAAKKLGVLLKVRRYFTPEPAIKFISSSSSLMHGVLLSSLGWLSQVPAGAS
ncbi:unnamed protein product [Euphydryas editha]|uniref:Uncharacterized protein n=1 Tax=Euphydryas editha TaxID=104508 RepID=A0AAU9UGX1_EUPED|nr:unnamed protein product [Euphydryas editha]